MTMSRDALAELDFDYEVPCETGRHRETFNARWRVTFLMGGTLATVAADQVVLCCTPCRDHYVAHTAACGDCGSLFNVEAEVLP